MKFYAKTPRISAIEGMNYDLLMGVDANLSGRGSMKVNDWANGWIFEADEEFPSYCMIRHGFTVPSITENEYRLLKVAKVVFFSKERTLQLRKATLASLPKEDK
jgi:hypothetical protein